MQSAGIDADTIIQAAIDQGDEPPEELVIDLWPPALPFWIGWWRLHRQRQHLMGAMGGMMPMGLSWTEVEAYARAHGAKNREDVQEWDMILEQMDLVYFEHVEAQRKANA